MNETNKDKKPDLKGLKPKPGKPKFSFYWIYAILAVAIIGLQFMNWGTPAKEIQWGEVREKLMDQDVERIVLVNREFAEIYIKKEKLIPGAKIVDSNNIPICILNKEIE